MSKGITDIRARKLEKAGRKLTPVLIRIHNEIGLDLTLTLLMYYAAKGIMLTESLTEEQRTEKIQECISYFNSGIRVHKKMIDKESN